MRLYVKKSLLSLQQVFVLKEQILINIHDVFTCDASGLVALNIFSKYSAASRCSHTEGQEEQKSMSSTCGKDFFLMGQKIRDTISGFLHKLTLWYH